ncbi:hypothetical protein DERP_005872 [Dermatophagoides pteronyssinus]|uniref:Uncharacterized protein n=1 Tax=Dermatophagoides pteronyssinus TaxID=6956 RepID=A0ABQ8J9U8_DERPT|nr:hypothetical protein DERP_005872 [Dermatophagoides pteronyssinus]
MIDDAVVVVVVVIEEFNETDDVDCVDVIIVDDGNNEFEVFVETEIGIDDIVVVVSNVKELR